MFQTCKLAKCRKCSGLWGSAVKPSNFLQNMQSLGKIWKGKLSLPNLYSIPTKSNLIPRPWQSLMFFGVIGILKRECSCSMVFSISEQAKQLSTVCSAVFPTYCTVQQAETIRVCMKETEGGFNSCLVLAHLFHCSLMYAIVNWLENQICQMGSFLGTTPAGKAQAGLYCF